MGTDKTDPLKQKIQVFLLSVLVVKSVVKILQNPVRPCPLHSHCGQNSLSTGVRKKVNRELPILKARLFILQEFSTTESTKGTKGTKMKTSENFVISLPFVVKNLSFHWSE
jgi:hypothetical protein